MIIRALLVNPSNSKKHCLADIKADPDCTFEFLLPRRKAELLGLKRIPREMIRCQTIEHTINLLRYSELQVIVPLGPAPTELTINDILLLPDSEKRIASLDMFVRESDPDIIEPSTKISPIKNGMDRVTKLSVLLGLPGLEKLGLNLLVKEKRIEAADFIHQA